MDANTRTRIRHIFLSPRPHFPLNTVAELLEMSVEELKAEIKDGGIVAVSTVVGVRVTREEMVAAAMGRWETAVIEKALGREASRVLPEAIRLVELRARVPRYQKEMLRYLARQEGTSIGTILSRELEDMASARAEELAAAVPSVAVALQFAGGAEG
jgi:predicted site-specific integrase-resolvase